MSLLLQVIGVVLACAGSLLFSVIGIPADNPLPSILGYTAILMVGLGLFGFGRLRSQSDREGNGRR